MSVSGEITRLQSAKAALKTSINAKNDQQHQIDDETIDEYSVFVDLIPQGGETYVGDITGSGARTIDLTSLTDDAVYHGHKKVTATTNEAVGFYVIKQSNNVAYIVKNWLGNYVVYFQTTGIIDSRSGYFTFVGDYEIYKVTDTDY